MYGFKVAEGLLAATGWPAGLSQLVPALLCTYTVRSAAGHQPTPAQLEAHLLVAAMD